jgi:hypothetical protein
MDTLGKEIRDAIGKVMNDGVPFKVVVPIRVDGHPDLMTTAEIEVPHAYRMITKIEDDGSIKRIPIHGRWDAKKQMIVWDEP